MRSRPHKRATSPAERLPAGRACAPSQGRVSASGARAGACVTTNGVEGAHEARAKAQPVAVGSANRLRKQIIILLLKEIARPLEIGRLRIGYRQRGLSRSAAPGALRLDGAGDLSPPRSLAFHMGEAQLVGEP